VTSAGKGAGVDGVLGAGVDGVLGAGVEGVLGAEGVLEELDKPPQAANDRIMINARIKVTFFTGHFLL